MQHCGFARRRRSTGHGAYSDVSAADQAGDDLPAMPFNGFAGPLYLRGVLTTMRIRFFMPLIFVLSFMLLACQQTDNAAQPKLAVVDMARIMRDSEPGKAGVSSWKVCGRNAGQA